jgi:hypothetical protein
MKKFLWALALVLGLWSAACGPKKPSQEELDQKEAVRVDSLATDLNQAADSLDRETDELDKAISDLNDI